MKININKVISVKIWEHISSLIPLALDHAVSSNKILNGNLIGIHAIGFIGELQLLELENHNFL